MVHTANKLTKNKPCRKYGDTAKKKHNGQGMNIFPRNEIQLLQVVLKHVQGT
jgi:hypothetical protein